MDGTLSGERLAAIPQSPPGDLNPQPLDYKVAVCRQFAILQGHLRSFEFSEFASELPSSGHGSGHGEPWARAPN